jgi:hypothetical protein
VSRRTAGFILGGILAVAIGGGALLLRDTSTAQTSEPPAATPSATQPAPTPSATHAPAAPGPVTVAGIVRVQPAKGWQVRRLFLTHVPPYLRLVKDQVRINILAGTFDGSVRELADTYAQEFIDPYTAGKHEPTRHWIKLPGGALALRVTYTGEFGMDKVPTVHELTAVMVGSHGVVFDGWADPGRFDAARAEIDQMIDAAVIS